MSNTLRCAAAARGCPCRCPAAGLCCPLLPALPAHQAAPWPSLLLQWSSDSMYVLCANFQRALVEVFSAEDPEWRCHIDEVCCRSAALPPSRRAAEPPCHPAALPPCRRRPELRSRWHPRSFASSPPGCCRARGRTVVARRSAHPHHSTVPGRRIARRAGRKRLLPGCRL